MSPSSKALAPHAQGQGVLGKARILSLTWGLSLVALLVSRSSGEAGTDAADQFLAGQVAWTLPLSLVPLLWQTDKSALSPQAVWLVRTGRDRRRLWMAEHAIPFFAWLSSLLIASGVGLVVSRTRFDPLLGRDLIHTLPEILLGGCACYGALLASRVWLGRYGCLALAVLLFTVGHLGAASIASPVGHLRFLLGLGPDLEISPLYSEIVLGFLAFLGLLAAPLRVPR